MAKDARDERRVRFRVAVASSSPHEMPMKQLEGDWSVVMRGKCNPWRGHLPTRPHSERRGVDGRTMRFEEGLYHAVW